MKTNRYSIWIVELRPLVSEMYLFDNITEEPYFRVWKNQIVLANKSLFENNDKILIGSVDNLEEVESYIDMYRLIN